MGRLIGKTAVDIAVTADAQDVYKRQILGGCELELTGSKSSLCLSSKGRRNYARRISHDGVYAEGIHWLQDDPLQSLAVGQDDDDPKSEKETVSLKRNLYISVSYTHLDVYKRQALALADEGLAGGFIAHGEFPVQNALGVPAAQRAQRIFDFQMCIRDSRERPAPTV